MAQAAPGPAGSSLDRFARRVLLVEGRAPEALLPMRTSLLVAGLHCIVVYVLVPLLLPLAGWLAPVAAPVSVGSTLVAIGFALYGVRRVWLADWSGRWAYTAFAGAVVVALVVLLGWDLRTLLG